MKTKRRDDVAYDEQHEDKGSAAYDYIFQGNGKPPLTERVALVENSIDSITRNLTKLIWLAVATMFTTLSGAVLIVIDHNKPQIVYTDRQSQTETTDSAGKQSSSTTDMQSRQSNKR